MKSSKIGDCNILCNEKQVSDFFKVKRLKFNEVIKSNFKIYFPFPFVKKMFFIVLKEIGKKLDSLQDTIR